MITSKNGLFLLIFLGLIIAVAACQTSQESISFQGESQAWWDQLGLPHVPGLTVSQQRFDASTPFTTLGPELVVVAKRFLVPRTSILDPRQSISLGDKSLELVDPFTLELPWKGLRVQGLTIQNSGYPYFEVLVAQGSPASLKELDMVVSTGPVTQGEVSFLGFVGDIMAGRGIDRSLIDQNRGPSWVFGRTLGILQSVDFMVGNLEGAVTAHNRPSIKTYTFKFPPSILQPLKVAGFDYFMLTNNHAWDFGQEGFVDTLDALKQAGIPSSGVGLTIGEARRIHTFTKGRNSFDFMSFGAYPVESKGFDGSRMATATDQRPGMLWATRENLEYFSSLFKGAGEGTYRVALVHGGQEYRHVPDPNSRGLYQGIAGAGFDLVVGSHPHVLQGFEVYQGRLVVHSLGNFVFPGMEEMDRALETVVLTLGIMGTNLVYFEPHVALLTPRGVDLAPNDAILQRWYSQSTNLMNNPR